MAMKVFEARVFNREVREALRLGRPNETAFDDTWAETRFVEIKAMSADFARQIAEAHARMFLEGRGVGTDDIDVAHVASSSFGDLPMFRAQGPAANRTENACRQIG